MSRRGQDRWRWPVRLAVLLGILLLVAAPLLRFWVSPALAQAPPVPPGGSTTYLETGGAHQPLRPGVGRRSHDRADAR